MARVHGAEMKRRSSHELSGLVERFRGSKHIETIHRPRPEERALARLEGRPQARSRYAAEHKPNSEPLDRFVKRKGGINKCVARFSFGHGRRRRSHAGLS